MMVTIHQPCFLPWMGFFSKLAWSDCYLALDSAQFRKRHFQDRVRIVDMHGEPDWLSIPTGDNLGLEIRGVSLDPSSFLPRISKTLSYSYANAPFFRTLWPDVSRWLSDCEKCKNLAEFNICLIENVNAALFGEMKRIDCTSSLGIESRSTQRLVDLLREVGATSILLGGGASSSSKVHDLDELRRNGFSVYMQNFNLAGIMYPQHRRRRSPFVEGLSILDALFNVGIKETAALLRRESLRPWRLE